MNDFYKGKKIFITGHTGFKGSWLSLWLHSMGAEVTGYALEPPTKPSIFKICNIASQIKSIHGDICNREALTTSMKQTKPDIVIHMAAQPLVRDSYKYPIETLETNIMGTANLLEAIRQCPGVKAVVNITSDKCYENKEWVWGYRENEPMGGHDPYSCSKACSELVTSAYRNSFFQSETNQSVAALASARAGNVIGGGDWATDRLVPDCFRALLNNEPIVIRNPNAIRPWQHVLEPLYGYLLLAMKLYETGTPFAEAWNFGPLEDDARPVEWIVQEICKLWDNSASYQLDQGKHPHEANYLKLDCSKTKTKLEWFPRWQLKTALKKTVQWTRAYQQKQNMTEICLQQIKEYMATSGPQ
jgi:CDP-glucose 4,6-dehydratase